MSNFLDFFSKISPRQMAAFLLGSSVLALAGALIGQYGFNLHPCDLCLYQRVPFILIIILALITFVKPNWYKYLISASALLFLVNSCIAFYHSGVERKWWAGLSGCSTPDMSGSIEDVIKRIQETSVIRCDEIPWDFLGLSMANYNVVYCLGLAFAVLVYIIRKN